MSRASVPQVALLVAGVAALVAATGAVAGPAEDRRPEVVDTRVIDTSEWEMAPTAAPAPAPAATPDEAPAAAPAANDETDPETAMYKPVLEPHPPALHRPSKVGTYRPTKAVLDRVTKEADDLQAAGNVPAAIDKLEELAALQDVSDPTGVSNNWSRLVLSKLVLMSQPNAIDHDDPRGFTLFLDSSNLLRHACGRMQNEDKSLKILGKLCGIQETTIGLDHPDTQETLLLMASTLQVIGHEAQLAAARNILETIFAVQIQTNGNDDTHTKMTALYLGEVLMDSGDFDASTRFIEATEAAFKKTHGHADPCTLHAKVSLAMLRLTMGRNAEAEAILKLVRETDKSFAEGAATMLEDVAKKMAKYAVETHPRIKNKNTAGKWLRG